MLIGGILILGYVGIYGLRTGRVEGALNKQHILLVLRNQVPIVGISTLHGGLRIIVAYFSVPEMLGILPLFSVSEKEPQLLQPSTCLCVRKLRRLRDVNLLRGPPWHLESTFSPKRHGMNPPNTMILIKGTHKKVPLILGNSHIEAEMPPSRRGLLDFLASSLHFFRAHGLLYIHQALFRHHLCLKLSCGFLFIPGVRETRSNHMVVRVLVCCTL